MPASKIAPCLWFDGHVEEAARFYCSVFERSRVVRTSRYPDVGKDVHHHAAGDVLTMELELDGVALTLLNGGPDFRFNEAVSLQVFCDTQAEIDRIWARLSAGGDEKAQQCGWLKDRYGVSWQVVPTRLLAMIADPDLGRVGRVVGAYMGMKKFDLARLEAAYAG